jgi:hypothetical protein
LILNDSLAGLRDFPLPIEGITTDIPAANCLWWMHGPRGLPSSTAGASDGPGNRELGRDDNMASETGEDEARNERRRRIAEELIATQMRRRQRARTEKALLDSAQPSSKEGSGEDADPPRDDIP